MHFKERKVDKEAASNRDEHKYYPSFTIVNDGGYLIIFTGLLLMCTYNMYNNKINNHGGINLRT